MAIAAETEQSFSAFDISAAFVNAPLEGERVFCRLPQEWGGKLVQLKKALYGFCRRVV